MASETSHRTPNAFVVFLGTAAAFGVVALVFGGRLASYKPVDEVETKRAAQRLEARTKLDTEAQAKLDSLGWVDKAKGTVHVPIADAMKLVVADLRAKKPAPSSVKVEAPLPMPVADPKSAEPPPAALPSAPQGADTVLVVGHSNTIPAIIRALGGPMLPDLCETSFGHLFRIYLDGGRVELVRQHYGALDPLPTGDCL